MPIFKLNEEIYNIPDSIVDQFKKDNPGATETEKPGKTNLTSTGADVKDPAAPDTDSKPGVTSSGFTKEGEILLTGQPFEEGGWAITSVPLEEVVVTADQYYKRESEVARNVLLDFGIPEIEKRDMGELKPITAFEETQRISKAEIEQRKKIPEKPKTLRQSIANSTGQAMNRFAQIDDYGQYLYHMILSDTDIAYNIFGEEFGNKVLKHNRTELGKQEAKLKRYATLTKPAFAFTDISKDKSIGKNIIYGAGGAINAIMNVGSSAILSASTAGVGLGIEIIGQTIAEHNRTLAQVKGMNLEQLQESGMFEITTPLTIGALRYKLEKIGLDKLSKSILGSSPSLTKNIVDLTFTTGFNGTQEWVDVGLETINKSLAEGKSQTQAEEDAWKFMTSKEGYESFLQGAFGSTGIVLGARGLRTAANLRNKDEYDSLRKIVGEIGNLERAKLKKGISQESINVISEKQNKLIEEVKANVEKNNEILFSLTENQIKEINSQAEIIKIAGEKAKIINQDRSLDNETKTKILIEFESEVSDAEKTIFNIRARAEELTKQTEKVKRAAKYVDNLEIQKFDNQEQINEFINNQNDISQENKNQYKKRSNSYGFIIQNPDTNKQTIIINSDEAFKTGEGINVANHEFMHALLFKSLKSNPTLAKNLASALNEELNNLNIDNIKNSQYKKRLKKYLKDPKIDSNTAAEEALTLFSDALRSGDITLKSNKISDGIRSLTQAFGVKTKFNSGKDVINFIKDINKSVDKGTLTKEQIRIAQGFDKLEGRIISEELIGNKEEQVKGIIRKESRKISSDKVQEIYESQGAANALDIIDQFKPITNKIVNRYKDVPGFEFELLRDEIETGKRGILDMIMDYTPEKAKGAPLAAYINSLLPKRAIEAANRILDTEFKLDVTEAKSVTDTTTEEATEIQEQETSEELKSLRKKMGIGDEIIPVVFAAVQKTFGTKLPNINEKTFKKELEKRYRTELKKPISKLFGKGEAYESFLRDNFETIYNSLPQSIFNKRLKEFAEPVLDKDGKQKREKTAEGNKIFTKKKISKAEFIKYFLGSDVGRSTQGTRKTAIVEAVAEAFAFDATMEVLSDPTILQKAKDIAELQGKKLPENFVNKLSEIIDRPIGFKFSLPVEDSKILEDNNIIPYKLETIDDIPNFINDIRKMAKIFNTEDYKVLNKSVLQFTAKALPDSNARKELTKQLNKLVKEGVLASRVTIGRNKITQAFGRNLKELGKAFEDGRVKKWNEKHTAVGDKLWDDIKKAIDNDRSLAVPIMYFLSNSINEVTNPHRMWAPLEAYEIGAEKIHYEHAMQSTNAYRALINTILKRENFEKKKAEIKENYKIIAVDTSSNSKLEKAGFSKKFLDKWTNWWQRYFNEKVAKIDGGIDPKNIIFPFNENKTAADLFNIGSPSGQSIIKESKSLSKEFNKLLEQTTGVPFYEKFSPVKATIMGKGKGKKFFIPYSADDFVGLLYATLGTKKQGGNEQMRWYEENLLRPFSRGIQQYETAKQVALRNWQNLKKEAKKDVPGGLNKINEAGFTNQNSLRVYMWKKQGIKNNDIPGIAAKEIRENVQIVQNNSKLKAFAEKLMALNPEGYPAPSVEWIAGDITTDLVSYINDVKRAEYLTQWKENVDQIFNDQNKNKLKALYGEGYVKALDNMLYRMEKGRNKFKDASDIERKFQTWTNNSVGAIMFFNARSAVLQTLSAVNFINFSDNNPIAAGIALANFPQYVKDFSTLFNSDFLKQRRSGLQTDVNADEIAKAAATSKNQVQAMLAAILKFGFTPTQIADSFAIASGGATFYRNRINKYKKEGLSQQEAEQRAFTDFQEIAEETQQSARPDRISMQQAGSLGRLILAFGNTPMQYARLTKKATLDLINGRGDWKTNISKIAYYSVIQNIIFSALQQGLFALLFDDEEDEDKKSRFFRIGNSSVDTLLRGAGVYGAAAATVKNMILKTIEEAKKSRSDYTKVAIEATAISPPINSKLRKLVSAGKTFTYKQSKEKVFTEGFSLDNPAFLAAGKVISAGTNLPADRLVLKMDHIYTAMQPETELWQGIALSLGWGEWELGMIEKQTKKSKDPLKELKKIQRDIKRIRK